MEIMNEKKRGGLNSPNKIKSINRSRCWILHQQKQQERSKSNTNIRLKIISNQRKSTNANISANLINWMNRKKEIMSLSLFSCCIGFEIWVAKKNKEFPIYICAGKNKCKRFFNMKSEPKRKCHDGNLELKFIALDI